MSCTTDSIGTVPAGRRHSQPTALKGAENVDYGLGSACPNLLNSRSFQGKAGGSLWSVVPTRTAVSRVLFGVTVGEKRAL